MERERLTQKQIKILNRIKNCKHEIENISQEGMNHMEGYICKKCGLHHIEVTPGREENFTNTEMSLN